MIAIIDYDAGNIKSVEKAGIFKEEVRTGKRQRRDSGLDGWILPSRGTVMAEKLYTYGLGDVIREVVRRQIPFLGICLGLQLMFVLSERHREKDHIY